jgi:HlyD family secretion protein
VTEPVTRGNLVVIVTATGSVQPTKKVDVSSELSGMVRIVLVDYNSHVTAGQVLAELDTEKLQATVDSSRAKLAAARAKVADAQATVVEKERDLARKQALSSKDVASQHDLEVAQAARSRDGLFSERACRGGRRRGGAPSQ